MSIFVTQGTYNTNLRTDCGHYPFSKLAEATTVHTIQMGLWCDY